MKYYWLLFEILEICLSDVSHLDAIALIGWRFSNTVRIGRAFRFCQDSDSYIEKHARSHP